jgi:hypothetical protein
MKRVLFILAVALPLVFAGCEKEDEKEITTTWIQVKIHFDEPDGKGKGPEGQVFLFALDGKHPKDLKPYVLLLNDLENYLCFLKDVNDENIFSDYHRSFKSDKDLNTGKYINESTFTIYSFNLPDYLYDKDQEYLLVIYFYTPLMTREGSTFTGGHTIAYKKIKFSNTESAYSKTFEIAPISPNGGYTLWVQW